MSTNGFDSIRRVGMHPSRISFDDIRRGERTPRRSRFSAIFVTSSEVWLNYQAAFTGTKPQVAIVASASFLSPFPPFFFSNFAL